MKSIKFVRGWGCFIFVLASIIQLLSMSGVYGKTDFGWPKAMVVSVPVADVRHKPAKVHKKRGYGKVDRYQTTQLLFGEKIIAFEEKNGFMRINAGDQRIFVGGKWYGCSGWIRSDQAVKIPSVGGIIPPKDYQYTLVVKSSWANIVLPKKNKYLGKKRKNIPVSIGTKLCGLRAISVKNRGVKWEVLLPDGGRGYIDAKHVNALGDRLHHAVVADGFGKKYKSSEIRGNIVKAARRFVGVPYFWGGRSMFSSNMNKKAVSGFRPQLTSVDCSGMITLCSQVFGIDLPRNSKSQYEFCKKITSRPKPADLIFISSTKNPKNIFHVIIYAGKGKMVEARGRDVQKVVISDAKKRFGGSITELKSGDKVKCGYIFFGSFL